MCGLIIAQTSSRRAPHAMEIRNLHLSKHYMEAGIHSKQVNLDMRSRSFWKIDKPSNPRKINSNILLMLHIKLAF